jgi:DNA ligase-1
MSRDKRDFHVEFFVFDHIRHESDPYDQRMSRIHMNCLLRQTCINTLEELLALEQTYLSAGYEGLILRSPSSPYKRGRSTINEGHLLKVKRFSDCEATVIDFVERMHNANPLETDELGFAKRSSHQANMVGRGDLGALVVKMADGTTFNVGTGFTDEDRSRIWSSKERYRGALAKVKYLAVGVKDAPRHPVFIDWRHKDDT